jgi:hypothetical protein
MRLALARSDRLEASADKNHRADIEAVLMSAAPRPLYLSSRSMPGDFPFANLIFHPRCASGNWGGLSAAILILGQRSLSSY